MAWLPGPDAHAVPAAGQRLYHCGADVLVLAGDGAVADQCGGVVIVPAVCQLLAGSRLAVAAAATPP